jgi:hypothetical protein
MNLAMKSVLSICLIWLGSFIGCKESNSSILPPNSDEFNFNRVMTGDTFEYQVTHSLYQINFEHSVSTAKAVVKIDSISISADTLFMTVEINGIDSMFSSGSTAPVESTFSSITPCISVVSHNPQIAVATSCPIGSSLATGFEFYSFLNHLIPKNPSSSNLKMERATSTYKGKRAEMLYANDAYCHYLQSPTILG